MRSLELRTERHDDRGLNRVVNWVYGACANYGYSPGRPLLIAALLYILAAFFFLWYDGGSLGMNTTDYHGWSAVFADPGKPGIVARSVLLPLQTILNPFGLFGVRKLVVAATLWGQIVLILQGILTYLLFLMTILGIRKRFKLH